MSNTAYSDLKAAWHAREIAAMRSGQTIAPKQVQLIISDLCNHDCHFCAYRMTGGFSTEQFGENGNMNPNRRIPAEKCKEILYDCAAVGVKAIQFTGGGEPTVHPDHLQIFGYAQSIGLETALVSNGSLLRAGWEDVFPRMAWIRVSMDAGTARDYAQIRRIGEDFYAKNLANVKKIADRLRETRSKCLFGLGFVITRENYANLLEGMLRFRDSGAHYVRLSAMFSTLGAAYYAGVEHEIRELVAKAKEMETADFKVVDLFGNRISDLEQHAPDYTFCGYQQFNCYIGGDQKVYRCCTTSYTKHGEIGDLRDQRFADWFASDARARAYVDFDARSCHTCQFNDKNRVINYLVGAEPVHVNFV